MISTSRSTRVDPPEPSQGGRELARALELLERNTSRPVTLADLRERGISAPGQAIYDLQLAGHMIDRVPSIDAEGHVSSGYHLRYPPPPAAELPDQSDEERVSGSESNRAVDVTRRATRPKADVARRRAHH